MKKRKVINPEELSALLDKKGISLRQIEEIVAAKEAQKNKHKVSQTKTRATYKFGIVSDTHLVDKACALDELHQFYARCKKEGITEVVNSGDVLTGQGVYRGQMNDLVCFGLEEHLNFGVENYPKVPGITTYMIGGNHDESYKISFGCDILKLLAARRPDIQYLGMYDATLVLNGIKIGLHHGAGGPSYAQSYKLQRYVERLGSGDAKPQIYILGHYHGVYYMFYRNIHCFLPGCWQKPNDFSVRHALPNNIGGWIVEIEIGDDKKNSINRISPTFIPFYT